MGAVGCQSARIGVDVEEAKDVGAKRVGPAQAAGVAGAAIAPAGRRTDADPLAEGLGHPRERAAQFVAPERHAERTGVGHVGRANHLPIEERRCDVHVGGHAVDDDLPRRHTTAARPAQSHALDDVVAGEEVVLKEGQARWRRDARIQGR